MAAGRAECVAIRTACPGKYEASWLRVSVVASPLPCRSSQLVARSCWQSQQSGRVLSAWLTLSRSAAGGERTGQRARGGREGDRCGPAESDTRRGARVQVGQIHECRTWELGVAVAVAAVLRELRVVRVLGCLRCLRCLALLRLSIRGGRETQWQGESSAAVVKLQAKNVSNELEPPPYLTDERPRCRHGLLRAVKVSVCPGAQGGQQTGLQMAKPGTETLCYRFAQGAERRVGRAQGQDNQPSCRPRFGGGDSGLGAPERSQGEPGRPGEGLEKTTQGPKCGQALQMKQPRRKGLASVAVTET